MWANCGAKEGDRERELQQCIMGAVKGGEKINMVLNIHYLCLSFRWEVPRGDFDYDEVVFVLPTIV